MPQLHVLIIEDRPADAEMMMYQLRKAGFELEWRRVETEAEYLAHLDASVDIILADYTLPQFTAPTALQLLQARGLDIPFIVVTGTIGEEAAVECMKSGAADYLLKDRMARLGPAVAKALDDKSLRDDKKQAEETLRASEERYRRLIESSDDMIFSVNRAGIFKTAGGTRLREFGLEPEEVVGHTLDELFGAYAEQYHKLHLRVFATGAAVTYEHSFDFAGMKKTDLTTVYPIRNDRGEIETVGVICRDITARRLAEEALRESEGRFAAFMDHLPAAAFIKDEHSLIQYVNQYMKTRFGAADWLGRSCQDYFPADLAQRMLADDRKALAEGAFSREELLPEKDGAERWYQIYKFAINREGKPPLLGGVALDITDRKKMQQQLLHAGKLSAIGHLSASIIHEVNNPVQAMIGLLSLALEGAARGEDIREYLQVAYDEVWRIARTVNRVRGFSKPVTEEEKELCDINDLVRQVLELTAKQCQHNGVEVRREFHREPLLLEVVSDQIQQVFLNLMINALDAMPKGGRLQVSTAFTTQPPGARISFQDSGMGIAPEILPRIFDTFFTTKESGTGLGLGISKDIVERHDGSIAVESHPGAGTTFTVWLPALSEIIEDNGE